MVFCGFAEMHLDMLELVAAFRICLIFGPLSEELARMKEKDRLRKEYVEELRKRHEEEASRLETQLAKEQRARREEQAARVEVELVASPKL